MLKGGANSGKTSTMRLVHCQLCPGKEYLGRRELGNPDGDFECSFDYDIGNNVWDNPEDRKVRIAIYSMGDYVESVRENIDKYSNDCDILVCTSRYGKLINSLKPEFDKYEPVYIDKTKDVRFMRLANLYDAERVIETIHRMIYELKG